VFYVVLGVLPFFLHDLVPIALSRVGVGLTEGVVLTVTTTLLGDYFKGRARDRLLGFQAAIATVSASVLIPLSGYLGSRLGWNGPFLIYGLAAVWLVGILLFTWEPSPDAGAGEKRGSASWAGFPWKKMTAIGLSTLFGACFFYTVQFEGPTILPDFGIADPARIGFLMGIASWGMVVGALGFQLVVNRSTGALLFGELALIAASFFVMSRAPSAHVLIGASFMNQVACGALLPTLLTACMRFLPFEHRGRGAGIWQAMLASGQFVVGMSFPALTQITGGSKLHSLYLLAVAAATAAVGALAFVYHSQGTGTASQGKRPCAKRDAHFREIP
jgi:MFS family permease